MLHRQIINMSINYYNFFIFLQAFQLTGHLVYWAKATVIYPLCEGNVYVVAPGANIHVNSPLVEEFAKEFPGLCLLQVSSMFVSIFLYMSVKYTMKKRK